MQFPVIKSRDFGRIWKCLLQSTKMLVFNRTLLLHRSYAYSLPIPCGNEELQVQQNNIFIFIHILLSCDKYAPISNELDSLTYLTTKLFEILTRTNFYVNNIRSHQYYNVPVVKTTSLQKNTLLWSCLPF